MLWKEEPGWVAAKVRRCPGSLRGLKRMGLGKGSKRDGELVSGGGTGRLVVDVRGSQRRF